MQVFGFDGPEPEHWVALMAALLPHFQAAGLRVSAAVEMPEDFDLDRPGKDSAEHRRVGASEVVLASEERWAIMADEASPPGRPAGTFLRRLAAVDLVLLAGFSKGDHDRIAILGDEAAGSGAPDKRTVAFVSDAQDPGSTRSGLPVFRHDDDAAISAFILSHGGLGAAR